MGDLSTEPSMEDILSSIKRIIAEEGEQPARRARPVRTSPAVSLASVEDPGEDEVLELSEALPPPRASSVPIWPEPIDAAPRAPEPRAEPTRAEPARAAAPRMETDPVADSAASPEPIVSTQAAAASRGALESLSRMLVKPEPGNDGTLEGMVREMLRPMLREWLDANLPAMVETMVSREIARIARP